MRDVRPALYLAILLVGVYTWLTNSGTEQAGSIPIPSVPVVEAYDVTSGALLDDKTRWSVDFLALLGNTQPTIETLAVVNAWQNGEHVNGELMAEANNPLATTQTMPGNGCWNYNSDGSCHVKTYNTREEGLYASARTIGNGRYPNMLEALQTNNPEQFYNADELGTWGTGLANVSRTYDAERAALLALFDTPDPSMVEVSSPNSGKRERGTARVGIINTALTKVGAPYQLGTEGPDTFDCSGFVHWVYAQNGYDLPRTTYTQLDGLAPLTADQVQPGDMVYFQFPTDQHTGILADVDGNGTWDLIQAGGYFNTKEGNEVHVLYDLFEKHPTFYNAIIGYRSAL